MLETDATAWIGRAFDSGTRTVSQALINAFATLTEDSQFIHIDPAAAAETPFGGTVAHGFLLLSMLSTLAHEALPRLPGQRLSINAGFDRIRFVRPCRAGTEIRARFRLVSAEPRAGGHVALAWDVALEDAANPEPPLVAARWLTRLVADPA